jgi:hypothetical protein
MTEYFKQIVDAWGDRLRSPVLGSILIFFVATNWQSVFYLFFADKPVRARLLYFDANTDGWSLYVIPVIGGVVLAIAVPWISLAGAFLAKFPRAYLHSVQSSEAQKRRIIEYELKAEEEDAKASVEEATERRKIDAAKRLNEAGTLSDELRTEIEEGRDENDELIDIDDREKAILNFAASTSDGTFTERDGTLFEDTDDKNQKIRNLGDSHLEKRRVQSALQALVRKGGLDIGHSLSGGKYYEITLPGYSAIGTHVEK